jgi:hypothetical protein
MDMVGLKRELAQSEAETPTSVRERPGDRDSSRIAPEARKPVAKPDGEMNRMRSVVLGTLSVSDARTRTGSLPTSARSRAAPSPKGEFVLAMSAMLSSHEIDVGGELLPP